MLLTELILSKRGPLAKVWLSAHQERKLTKQQALGVDVEESVDAILTQEDGPITLRLSGQLMLGVTRIYSRKVQYLLDDCKEAREKITLAFRPGIVDLPEDQIRASKNAITFSDQNNDFNFLDWTWAAPPPEAALKNLNTVSSTQINLRPATREFGAYNFGRPRLPSIYGGSSSSRHPSHDHETSSHLDSQDFSGIDLGLNLDDTIEIGREALAPLSRDGSIFSQRRKRDSSMLTPIEGEPGVGFDTGLDLNLDFGDLPELPVLEERSRRESSALSTAPPVSPEGAPITDMTPRTAALIQTQADGAPAKPKRARLLQADDELELVDDDFAAPDHDNSAILGEERYIAADPEMARLREIVADPASHFLPQMRIGAEMRFFVGPEGLAPELAQLFSFPTNVLRRDRSDMDEERASKRPRVEEDEEIEVGRRVSVIPSERFDQFQAGADDTFQLDIAPDQPEFELGLDMGPQTPRKEPSLAPSRAESVARAIQFSEDTGGNLLSMFDSRTRAEAVESQYSLTPSKSVAASDQPSRTGSGYSENTGMAMGLLRRELDAIEEEDKVLSFEAVASRATKKAASAFFFELLVLGTRDAVKLDQPTAFGDISIHGKDKLFEGIAA